MPPEERAYAEALFSPAQQALGAMPQTDALSAALAMGLGMGPGLGVSGTGPAVGAGQGQRVAVKMTNLDFAGVCLFLH